MAFTKIVSPGIDTTGSYTVQELNTVGIMTAGTVQVGAATTVHTTGIDLGSGNITSHNINSTGIITATSFVGPVTGAITGTATTATNAQGLTGSPSITVTDITASGNVSIGGTLTYEDVTNIDAVGVITARNGIHVSGGDVGIGVTNPTSFGPTLQVSGTDPALLLQDTATAVDYFGINVTSGITQLWYDDAADFTINTATAISGPGLSEKLRITSGGQSKFTVGTNKYVKIYAAAHNDETDLGAGIAFSRPSDGADMLSGMFAHSNTGLGIAARDHITFLTGGTSNISDTEERFRITSAGRVGVNIDNPNTVLHIKSSQNSDGLTVTKGSNVSAFLGHNGSGDEGLFTLKEGGTTKIQLYAETNQDSYINSGDFGIGTNSPVTKLDVRPTAEYPTTGSPAAGSFLQIRADDATVGKGPSLALMNLSGSKETGWRLSALTASGNNGDFTIHGYGGGATYSERLRITADGKTGIGGITPQNLLNVNATGSMGLYGTTAGKAGHSIRFIRKYGSSATHNFAVVNGASPHGQSRLGGFVATYTFRSAYGFDSDGGGHGVRMLSGRVRDSGEWGFDTETNYGTGDSPRPTLQGVDNSDGTCTLQVVNPGSTHSYGEFHIVAWDCQITTPTT